MSLVNPPLLKFVGWVSFDSEDGVVETESVTEFTFVLTVFTTTFAGIFAFAFAVVGVKVGETVGDVAGLGVGVIDGLGVGLIFAVGLGLGVAFPAIIVSGAETFTLFGGKHVESLQS
jgi:hypothetical protein